MNSADPRPVLVFDGDCSFCRAWIGYWKELTGGRVEYVPYQEAAGKYPDVPVEEFRNAVQLFAAGSRYSAAEAVFHLLTYADGPALFTRGPIWLYKHLAVFSALTEFGYRLIAKHRGAGYWLTRALWGTAPSPATWKVASSIFARAIAAVYLVAFISCGTQVRGLIGERGIQPVAEFFTQVARQFGSNGFWQVPSLFWWVRSDFGLESIVWGGAVIAAVCAIGRPHTSGQKAAFVLLYIYYLSVVSAGQIFMGYQWDYLLLEAGFLAIFLRPTWTRTFLFRWLLFRLMFESGAVKLLSHDPTWRGLTALSYHFQTQPLPTPLAWYMHQAPLWFLQFSTLFVFVVELVLPFLIFGPRRLKHVAAWGTIALQLMILLTGNYTFFNILTIALCLFLFDDASFRKKRSQLLARPHLAYANSYVSAVVVTIILIASLDGLAGMFGFNTPAVVSAAVAPVGPFGIVNQYGLFASMTTSRPEISIEGSNDGETWQAYTFSYKPGPLNRAPGVIEPFQPRLDWQMWFAALSNYQQNPWLIRFMQRLLEGSPPVLQLLAYDPFPEKPPKFVRAVVYDYRFTTFAERRQTGNWWKRETKGMYFPAVSLR